MVFTGSQNARFRGPAPCDDTDVSERVVAIGQRLEIALKERFTITQDDWYEIGYSFAVLSGSAQFSIVVAETGDDDVWILQLICTNEPAWLKQLVGWRAVDRSGEVHELAMAIHDWLIANGFSELRWQVDGFPDDATSSPVPQRRKLAQA